MKLILKHFFGLMQVVKKLLNL